MTSNRLAYQLHHGNMILVQHHPFKLQIF